MPTESGQNIDPSVSNDSAEIAVGFLDSDALAAYRGQRVENKVGDILKSAGRGAKKLNDPACAKSVLKGIMS